MYEKVAVVEDDFQEFASFLCRLHCLQHVAEAHDGIERGSDFVCHVGKEHTLKSCRVLCPLAFFLHADLCVYEFIDISYQSEATFDLSFVVVFRHAVDGMPCRYILTIKILVDEHHGIAWHAAIYGRVDDSSEFFFLVFFHDEIHAILHGVSSFQCAQVAIERERLFLNV